MATEYYEDGDTNYGSGAYASAYVFKNGTCVSGIRNLTCSFMHSASGNINTTNLTLTLILAWILTIRTLTDTLKR